MVSCVRSPLAVTSLTLTPDSTMVLTGKQALDFSGGVSAEDTFGIGGYDRVMGPNGQAQYWAPSLPAARDVLMAHYDHTYVLPGESGPVAHFMYQCNQGTRVTLYVRTEAANNRDAEKRKSWEPAKLLREYEVWGNRVAPVMKVVQAPGVRSLPVRKNSVLAVAKSRP